jgi:hypothetical protein
VDAAFLTLVMSRPRCGARCASGRLEGSPKAEWRTYFRSTVSSSSDTMTAEAQPQQQVRDPRSLYQLRRARGASTVEQLDRRDARIAYLRLVVFAAGLLVAWLSLISKALSPLWLIVPILTFVGLVTRHDERGGAASLDRHAVQHAASRSAGGRIRPVRRCTAVARGLDRRGTGLSPRLSPVRARCRRRAPDEPGSRAREPQGSRQAGDRRE